MEERLVLVLRLEFERSNSLLKSLVVLFTGREPLPVVATERARSAAVTIEVTPVSVVHVLKFDKFLADELLDYATLGLLAKNVHSRRQHDDKAVTGVRRLGKNTCEMSRLAALHIPDHEPFTPETLYLARIGHPFNHGICRFVQLGDVVAA